jgi:hypothetical protein
MAAIDSYFCKEFGPWNASLCEFRSDYAWRGRCALVEQDCFDTDTSGVVISSERMDHALLRLAQGHEVWFIFTQATAQTRVSLWQLDRDQ